MIAGWFLELTLLNDPAIVWCTQDMWSVTRSIVYFQKHCTMDSELHEVKGVGCPKCIETLN